MEEVDAPLAALLGEDERARHVGAVRRLLVGLAPVDVRSAGLPCAVHDRGRPVAVERLRHGSAIRDVDP